MKAICEEIICTKNEEEILGFKCLHHSYLNRFLLNGQNILPNVSVIIPTYNRSPNPVKENNNPLGWCLTSLLNQESNIVDEVIVVDDASTDYTREVIKYFSEKTHIPIVHLRNSQNQGLAISRNRGIKESKNNLVMFLDDDCIFSKYIVFGADFTLSKLSENTAALQLPIYHRKRTPRPIKMREIGALDVEKGIMGGNYDGFPIEYLDDLENSLIDSELKIVKPFEIKNIGGVVIIKKDALEKIRYFPEAFTWKNAYRIETDVSLKLSDSGYKMFFTPDPKFYSIHLKYGANGNNLNEENLDPQLRRLVSQSNIPKRNTGCRVDAEEWFFDRIISDYVVLGIRSVNAAQEYSKRMHKMFVEDNKLCMTGVGNTIDDYEKRKYIFKRAMKEGNKLIAKLR